MSTKSSSMMTSNSSQWTYHIEPNDVLLGRGAPVINNKGNIRFRNDVNACKAEYIASCRHDVKNKIATDVLNTVASRGGRFLRKIEDADEASKLGMVLTENKSVYIVADEEVALQKVKQALREKGPKSLNMVCSSQQQSNDHRVCQKVDESEKSLLHDISFSSSASRGQVHVNPANVMTGNIGQLSYDDLLLLSLKQEQEKAMIMKDLLRRQTATDALHSRLALASYHSSPYELQSIDRYQYPGFGNPLVDDGHILSGIKRKLSEENDARLLSYLTATSDPSNLFGTSTTNDMIRFNNMLPFQSHAYHTPLRPNQINSSVAPLLEPQAKVSSEFLLSQSFMNKTDGTDFQESRATCSSLQNHVPSKSNETSTTKRRKTSDMNG